MYLSDSEVTGLNIKKMIISDTDTRRGSDAAILGILLLTYHFVSKCLAAMYIYVCYLIVSGGFTLDRNVVVQYFKDHKDKLDLVNSTSFQMSADIIITGFSLTVTLLLARVAFKKTMWSYMKADKKRVKTGFKWLGPCFVFNMIASMIISYITNFLSTMGVSVPSADFTIKQPSVYAIILQIAYVAILAPLFEEIVYRGLIIKILSPHSKSAAILISALAFGLMHGNIPQATSAFATGLIYAAIAIKCGSIVPTVIIHSLNNLVVNSPDLASAMGIKNYSSVISLIEICIALFGFFVWFTDYKFVFKYDDTPQGEEKKVAFTKVLTNPVIIVYFCVLLFVIVSRIITANS